MYVGYAWVPTQHQRLSLQLDALHAAGGAKVFVAQASGVQRDRPQQPAALDCGRLGDTLVVWTRDRLARRLWVTP
jgi:DNA invertase Pin-like site-specific DNA recombinase